MQHTAPKTPRTRPTQERRATFNGTPVGVTDARKWALAALNKPGWGIPNPDDFALVVSELATNALDHTHSGRGGKFTIRLALHEDHIRVTVRDAGPRQGRTPTRRTPQLTAEHGRGLGIVDALSRSWGVATIGTGVYAEVTR